MLRSLYSGVSGMKSQQTKMDVIGNNISNVNTTAFKSGSVEFKDMLSQTMDSGSAPAGGKGGLNPKQVGLGGAVAAINTNMSQGALQPTGRSTDMAIEGNGFYIISDGVENRFTRDGSFSLDKNGNLVTSEGFNVVGTVTSQTNNINNGILNVRDSMGKEDLTVSGKVMTQLKDIVIPSQALVTNPATDAFTIGGAKFQIIGDGASNFEGAWNIKVDAGFSNGIESIDPNTNTITLGGTFTSNQAFADQFNSKIQQLYPNCKMVDLGSATTVAVAANTSVTIPPSYATTGGDLGGFKFVFANSNLSNLEQLSGTWRIVNSNPTAGTASVSMVDNNSKTITIQGTYTDAKALASAITTAAGVAATSAGIPSGTSIVATDALPSGWDPTGLSTTVQADDTVKLTSFGIGKDGTISGIYGDKTVQIGRLAVANFQNAAGLTKTGGNAYTTSVNSGDPEIGDAATSGYGNVIQGSLEMSNVDLAEQFTEMIITSRAFQANSKTITTSDDMLQELINLKR